MKRQKRQNFHKNKVHWKGKILKKKMKSIYSAGITNTYSLTLNISLKDIHIYIFFKLKFFLEVTVHLNKRSLDSSKHICVISTNRE